MRGLKSIVCCLLVIYLMGSPAEANQINLGPESEQPAIRFLGDKDYPPIEWLEGDKPRGIFASFLEELSFATNRKITYKLLDWKQAQQDVLNNRGDVLTVFSPNDERTKRYDFIDGFLQFEISLFVRSDNLTIHGLEDLKDIPVGVTKGGFPRKIVETQSAAQLVTINNHLDGFEKLQNGEIEALATTKWVGAYIIQKNQIKGIKFIPKPIAIKSTHMGVRKGDKELIALLQAGIKKMQDDGTLDRLNQQWSGYNMVYLTESTVKQTLYVGLAALLGLFILIALSTIWTLRRKVRQKTKSLSEANSKLESSLDTLIKTQKKLIQTEKLAGLSTAVAGVAHEINTPIGVAITASSTILDDLKQLARITEEGKLSQRGLNDFIDRNIQTLELEAQSLRKAAALIQEFKRVATQQKMEHRETFELTSIVNKAIETVIEEHPFISINIEQTDNAEITMDSYPIPLYQVLVELMRNACLHAFPHEQEDKHISIVLGCYDNNVLLKVEDNGQGVENETLAKLFDPFFTAQNQISRSGLGLSITHTLVGNVLGGEIKVAKNKFLGLTFYLDLPNKAPEIEAPSYK